MSHWLPQFVRFGTVGAVGTAAHYGVLFALVEGCAASVVLATSVGALLGAVINYLLNYRFTFASVRPHQEVLPRFMLIAAAGLVLNAAIMAVLPRVGLYYLVAQVLATGAVLTFNFAANRLWTFKHPPI